MGARSSLGLRARPSRVLCDGALHVRRMGWRNVAVSLTDRVACETFSSVVLVSYGQGDFDPPRGAVMMRLDQLARDCGWKDRADMRLGITIWRCHFEGGFDERRERNGAQAQSQHHRPSPRPKASGDQPPQRVP